MEDPDDQPMEEVPQHPPVLENQTPAVITNLLSAGVGFLQQYGWHLLVVAAALLYLWNKLQPKLRQWQQQQQDGAAKKYDQDQVQQRTESLLLARQRMQEELDAKAARYAEEKKKREEEKRKQKIEDWERHQEGKGYRSKYKPREDDANHSASASSEPKPKPKKKPVRPEGYNPLMGDSSGFSYRPSRSTSGGG